jgi:hypothetical protein
LIKTLLNVAMGRRTNVFFNSLVEKINDDAAEEHLFVLPCDNQHYKLSYSEHLDNGHYFSAEEHPQGTLKEPTNNKQVRNILKALLRVRKAMFANITASGNGEDDPWMFATDGVKKGSAVTIMTMTSAYYFYMQCECFPEIIKAFTDNLKNEMLGEDVNKLLKPSNKKPRRSSPGNDDNSAAIVASLAAIAASFKANNNQFEELEKALATKNTDITNKMRQMEMMWRGSTLFAKNQIELLEAKIPLLQEEALQLELDLKMAKAAVAVTQTNLTPKSTPCDTAVRTTLVGHGSDDSDGDVDVAIIPRDLSRN